MGSPVFDLLEGKYRSKRQLYVLLWGACFLLSALAMISAVSALVGSSDAEPPSYWSCGTKTRAQCRADYQAMMAGNFAETRATFGIFPLLPALLFLALWWPIRNKNTPPLVQLLRDRPHDAVWVYIKDITIRRNGVQVGKRTELVIGEINRKLHTLSTDPREVAQFLPAFQALLPHATFGHDQERALQYARDPASMRRAGAAPPSQAYPAPQAQPGQGYPAPQAQPAQAYAASYPQAGGAQAPQAQSGGLRLFVAPQVPFGHIDHAMRGLGLSPEAPGAAVAPGEPGGAAWSAAWGRIVYRFEPSSWTRSLEIFAQDPQGLRARIAATGMPVSG